MLENILEYQSTEAELISTENEVAKSTDREKAAEIQKRLQNYKARLLELDNAAIKSNASFIKAKEKYQEYLDKLESLDKEIENADESKVALYEKAYKDFHAVANTLEKDIAAIYGVIQQIDVESKDLFEKSKQEKLKFNKYKEGYNKLKTEKEPAINSLKEKLDSMKKVVDKDLMQMYLQKREGKLFPVFAMLTANKCGGCRMEVSASKIGSMTTNKYAVIECENCGRYIYKK